MGNLFASARDTRPAKPSVAKVTLPTKSKPAVKKDSARERKDSLQINRRFIPETIDDPAPGDPCGLYIEGLNFHWERERFQKFLTQRGLPFQKAMKKKGQYFAKIWFDSNEDRRNAYRSLVNANIQNRQLFVVGLRKDIKATERLCHRLRARATSDLETRNVNDRIAPWHAMPYDEQITRKSEKYTALVAPIVPANSQPLTVFPAPKKAFFRNKVELTFGFDLNGEVCVGFNLGSKVEDVVAPVTDCVNVGPRVPDLAEHLRKFVLASGVSVFDRTENVGSWKFVLIRTTELDQSMMVVCTFGAIPEAVVEKLRDEFAGEVTSLYYVETTVLESYGKNPIVHHLSGPETIVERLRGLEFDISPMSFFQTNTAGAEVLFQKIEELAEVDEDTVLVDCCCGTGVIGLAMARNVKEVIGVDIEEAAIIDARKNAEKNGITNATFIAGKAEDVLGDVLKDYEARGEKIVCIVDPPRSGLHKKALWAIRDCLPIKRLVYVSCNPQSLVDNSQNVLMSTRLAGSNPFQPSVWFGVDMFPHTDRLELVMLMVRN